MSSICKQRPGNDRTLLGDNGGMRLADGAVIHQVHAAKIGTDVAAAVVSNMLLWRDRPTAAMAVRVILPVAGRPRCSVWPILMASRGLAVAATFWRICRRRRRR